MVYLLNFNITYIIIFATCFDYLQKSVSKLRYTHTNIATYTNQKPRFNTEIQKLQQFDTSTYRNRRRVQPEDLPTSENPPPPKYEQ